VHRPRRRFSGRRPDNSRPVSWSTFTWTGKQLSSDTNSVLHRPMINSTRQILPRGVIYNCAADGEVSEISATRFFLSSFIFLPLRTRPRSVVFVLVSACIDLNRVETKRIYPSNVFCSRNTLEMYLFVIVIYTCLITITRCITSMYTHTHARARTHTHTHVRVRIARLRCNFKRVSTDGK